MLVVVVDRSSCFIVANFYVAIAFANIFNEIGKVI
jgi:hypothetical protein